MMLLLFSQSFYFKKLRYYPQSALSALILSGRLDEFYIYIYIYTFVSTIQVETERFELPLGFLLPLPFSPPEVAIILNSLTIYKFCTKLFWKEWKVEGYAHRPVRLDEIHAQLPP